MKVKFVEWVQRVGKDYHDNDEFGERISNWKENNAEIREWNKKAEASGNPHAVKLSHNEFSDLSTSEI